MNTCRRCERAVYRDLDGEYTCIVHGTQYYPIVTPEVALAEVSRKRMCIGPEVQVEVAHEQLRLFEMAPAR